MQDNVSEIVESTITMAEIVSTINGYVWSPALIYLCLGAGLFFSILTRFVQVRMFREMIHLLFSSKESERGISSCRCTRRMTTTMMTSQPSPLT